MPLLLVGGHVKQAESTKGSTYTFAELTVPFHTFTGGGGAGGVTSTDWSPWVLRGSHSRSPDPLDARANRAQLTRPPMTHWWRHQVTHLK